MLTGGPRNFGYLIVDFGEGDNKRKRKHIFHTSDGEQIKEIFKTIEENHTEFPEPKTDWTPKLLIIKEHHGDGHFLVKSLEDLNKVAFDYLKLNWEVKPEYNYFKHRDESEYYKSVSQECIDLCENEYIKESMVKNNEASKENVKDTLKHNKTIDRVKELMEGDDNTYAYSILEECYFLFSHIELTTFSNEHLRRM
tara:strand:+ start:7482 stop:8069 length:588 start_codon:yes stop_codon:yes gene_type:complete